MLHENLFFSQMKEKAALSLGYLCVGECFPHTAEIANKIIATVKEVHKSISIHIFNQIWYTCVT